VCYGLSDTLYLAAPALQPPPPDGDFLPSLAQVTEGTSDSTRRSVLLHPASHFCQTVAPSVGGRLHLPSSGLELSLSLDQAALAGFQFGSLFLDALLKQPCAP
jgi:hypothetical protein